MDGTIFKNGDVWHGDTFEAIYKEAVKMADNGRKYQACIFIAGCYTSAILAINPRAQIFHAWANMRDIVNNNFMTNGDFARFRYNYNYVCAQIDKFFGRFAWYNTLTL